MHSFINNFFHKKLKDLAKFFLNIKGMGLVRMNTKKYNLKILDKLLLLLRTFSLVPFLPFEKGPYFNIYTIFK